MVYHVNAFLGGDVESIMLHASPRNGISQPIVGPSMFDVLPQECVVKICHRVGVLELHRFAPLCHQAHSAVKVYKLQQAQVWGYQGESSQESCDYFKEMILELKCVDLPWIREREGIDIVIGAGRYEEKMAVRLQRNLSTLEASLPELIFKHFELKYIYSKTLEKTRKFILKHASSIFRDEKHLIKDYTNKITDVLIKAVKHQRLDVIAFALEQGADLNLMIPKNGVPCPSAFHEAIINHVGVEIITFLLEKGADLHLQYQGETPLYTLVSIGTSDPKTAAIASQLLLYGADPNFQTANGESVLWAAVKWHQNGPLGETVNVLLAHEVDVHQTNPAGSTPLLKAFDAWDGNKIALPTTLLSQIKIIYALIRNGAHLRAVNNHGNTPLSIMGHIVAGYTIISFFLTSVCVYFIVVASIAYNFQ